MVCSSPQRYFVLDEGILVYGKGPSEINKGKLHGSVDIGLSVISSKAKRRRIDIDAEEFIYHLKAKTEDTFASWVQQLTEHRLYRQHVLSYGKGGYSNSTSDERSEFIYLYSSRHNLFRIKSLSHYVCLLFRNASNAGNS